MHKHPEHQGSQRHPQRDSQVQRIPLVPKAKGKEDPNRVMGRPQASHLHQAKMPPKGLHLPRPHGQRVRATAGQIARLLLTHRSPLKPLLKRQVQFPQLPQPQPLQLCCHQQVHMQLSQRHLELVNHCSPGPVSGGSSVALRVGFLFFLLPFQLCYLPSAAQHFLAFNPAPSM